MQRKPKVACSGCTLSLYPPEEVVPKKKKVIKRAKTAKPTTAVPDMQKYLSKELAQVNEAKIAQLQQVIKSLGEELEKYKDSLEKCQQAQADLQAQLLKTNAEYAAFQNEAQQSKNQLNQSQYETMVKSAEVTQLKQQLQQQQEYQNVAEQLKISNNKFDKELALKQAENETLKTQLQTLEIQLKKCQSADNSTTQLQQQITNLTIQNERLQFQFENKENDSVQMNKRIENEININKQKEVEITALKNEIEAIKIVKLENVQITKQNEEQKQIQKTFAAQLESKQKEINEVNEKQNELKNKTKTLIETVQKQKVYVTQVENQKEEMKTTFNQQIEMLKQQAQRKLKQALVQNKDEFELQITQLEETNQTLREKYQNLSLKHQQLINQMAENESQHTASLQQTQQVQTEFRKLTDKMNEVERKSLKKDKIIQQFQSQIQNLSQSTVSGPDFQAKFEQMVDMHTSLRQKLNEAQQSQDEKFLSQSQTTLKNIQELSYQNNQLDKQISILTEHNQELQDKIQRMSATQVELQLRDEQIQSQFSQIQKANYNYLSKNQSLSTEIDQLRQENEQLVEQKASLENKTLELAQKLEFLKGDQKVKEPGQILEFQQISGQYKEHLNLYKAKIEQINRQLVKVQESAQGERQQKQQIQVQLQSKEKEVESLSEKIQELRSLSTDLKNQVNKMQGDLNSYTQFKSEHQNCVDKDEPNRVIKQLEDEIAHLKSELNFAKSLQQSHYQSMLKQQEDIQKAESLHKATSELFENSKLTNKSSLKQTELVTDNLERTSSKQIDALTQRIQYQSELPPIVTQISNPMSSQEYQDLQTRYDQTLTQIKSLHIQIADLNQQIELIQQENLKLLTKGQSQVQANIENDIVGKISSRYESQIANLISNYEDNLKKQTQLTNTVQQELIRVQTLSDEKEIKFTTFATQIQQLTEENAGLKQTLQNTKEKFQLIKDKALDLKAQRDDLIKENQQQQTQIDVFHTQIVEKDSIQKQIQIQVQQIKEYESIIENLNAQINQQKIQLEALLVSLKDQGAQNQQLQKQMLEMQFTVQNQEQLHQELRYKQDTINHIQEQLNAKHTESSQLNAEISQLKSLLFEIEQKYEQISSQMIPKSNLTVVSQENKDLKEQIAILNTKLTNLELEKFNQQKQFNETLEEKMQLQTITMKLENLHKEEIQRKLTFGFLESKESAEIQQKLNSDFKRWVISTQEFQTIIQQKFIGDKDLKQFVQSYLNVLINKQEVKSSKGLTNILSRTSVLLKEPQQIYSIDLLLNYSDALRLCIFKSLHKININLNQFFKKVQTMAGLILNNLSACTFMATKNPSLNVPRDFSKDKFVTKIDFKAVLKDSMTESYLYSPFINDYLFVKLYFQAVWQQVVQNYSTSEASLIELIKDAVDLSRQTQINMVEKIEITRSGNLQTSQLYKNEELEFSIDLGQQMVILCVILSLRGISFQINDQLNLYYPALIDSETGNILVEAKIKKSM
ncbi:Conserved_hypothetical protein [Hexamita inflata]|uniref:Uncharacterized protein n=1 Tax=Hexamita inflata TaxID=28002 RepID=A0AA86UUM5_9EUKA|nr:Conserved hypothetical protein [Hexamita inflata]